MANSLTDINKILKEYVDDIQVGIEESSESIAKDGMDKLRNTKSVYNVRTGKYNKGWKVKKQVKKGYVSNTIYNKDHYQLTHLLENGHKNRDGSSTRRFVHIKPVEEYCVEKFQKEVQEIIKKGGK